jgi:hypothetical protein
MAIDIIGAEGSPEWDAACEFSDMLTSLLRLTDAATIVSGAKCWGQGKVDLDLVVLGTMAKGFVIEPKAIPADLRDRPAHLASFALTVEVKDLPPERLQIVGHNKVLGEYRGVWTDLSEQCFKQKYAAKKFVEGLGLESPFWYPFLWLRNFPSSQLPASSHNLLGSPLDGRAFLSRLVELHRDSLRWQTEQGWSHHVISASRSEAMASVHHAAAMFRKKIQPTALDRKRVERVCERLIKDGEQQQQYVQRLGKQLLVFRGRGGSGKTLTLLRLAKNLYDDFGHRVLFLTYNRALVSDLRRLFAILNVSDRLGERSISIRTSEKYFFSVLRAWNLAPSDDQTVGYPAEAYEANKSQLLELLRLSEPDQLRGEATWQAHPDLFQWDYVLVDEGQDWPDDERDLLYSMFGPERIVVADGVDQFVRDKARCDWRSGALFGTSTAQVVPLRRSLRLKTNLCRAVRTFAEANGLEWDLEVNEEVSGGRILLLEGPYTRDIHEKVMSAHRRAGNAPVDSLFCVGGGADAVSSRFATVLNEWDERVWDGTRAEERETFPTDPEQYRVVKYESCRGLEGWTVVCLDFDKFFELKRQHAKVSATELMQSVEDLAQEHAARWCMIPMTRAIDTLVLQVESGTKVSEMLRAVQRQHSDFVEML